MQWIFISETLFSRSNRIFWLRHFTEKIHRRIIFMILFWIFSECKCTTLSTKQRHHNNAVAIYFDWRPHKTFVWNRNDIRLCSRDLLQQAPTQNWPDSKIYVLRWLVHAYHIYYLQEKLVTFNQTERTKKHPIFNCLRTNIYCFFV